jgi:chromosome transmission fidelity protein 4
VPLLDTKQLDRLASGRKEETYWPVAVAQNAFHCIILKGGDKYPYFPRPLLSEFEFNIPVSSALRKASAKEDMETDEDASAGHAVQSKLQESFVRESLALSLLEDVVTAPEGSTVSQDAERRRKEVDIDKVILQLLAIECREGEERSMKAYELVTMVRDRTGKILDAAVKIAQRYDRTLLGEKIRELAEKRLMGEDEDEAYDNVGF